MIKCKNKMIKKCYNCKFDKALCDFSLDKTRGDGYSPICKLCKKSKHNKRINRKSENVIVPTSKLCNKCNNNLPISEFHKRASKSGEFHTYCKGCKLKQRIEQKQKIVILSETYTKQCIKCKIEKNKISYYFNNVTVDKLNAVCIECLKLKTKNWRDQNQLKIKEYRKKAYPQSLIHHKQRKQTDLDFKILCNLRSRINKALHDANKSDKTVNLLGCSITFFRNWLEHQFDSTMSWDNYGKWQIDHVIPCSCFNLQDEEEQIKCFNWKNCRPLEAKRNLIKNNKYLEFDILMQELKVYHYTRQTSFVSIDNKQHIQIAGNSLAS